MRGGSVPISCRKNSKRFVSYLRTKFTSSQASLGSTSGREDLSRARFTNDMRRDM